jgi:hypothetical protein
MKVRPVGAQLFHADRRTDMTKLIVVFRNFTEAPKTENTGKMSSSHHKNKQYINYHPLWHINSHNLLYHRHLFNISFHLIVLIRARRRLCLGKSCHQSNNSYTLKWILTNLLPSLSTHFPVPIDLQCRSQWARGLRPTWTYGLSLAGIAGLCFAGVSCECCVLSGSLIFIGLITRPEESYRV